ncbi:MAG: hypothetical protein MI919_30330, partial [Holophagales bacterium]|nr:hypothetical protein [Holophagales bacterium]
GDPGDPGEDDPTLIDFGEQPRIGAAKNATLDGTRVTFDLVLENLGNRTLSGLSLVEDLDATFGAGNYSLFSGPTFFDDPGTITLNGSFDGSTDTELIASGTLAVSDTAGIRLVVDITNVVDLGSGLGVYQNQVTASGLSPAITLALDLSAPGTDPDPDGNGSPLDPGEDDPTVFVVGEQPAVGVAKTATVNGSNVTFDLYLENLGNVELDSVDVSEDLDSVFGAGNWGITSGPTLVDDPGTLTLDPTFDGSSATELIDSGSLAIGDTARIQLTVRVFALADLGLGLGNYRNQVTVLGTTAAGAVASDLSDQGTDPDPSGDGDPTGAGEDDPTDFTVAPLPAIGLAKDAVVASQTVASIDVGGVTQNAIGT